MRWEKEAERLLRRLGANGSYKGFWFTVDLGEAKVLTGIKTNHWGNAYAPREVEILQSENGMTWKSLSSLAIPGSSTQTSRSSLLLLRDI